MVSKYQEDALDAVLDIREDGVPVEYIVKGADLFGQGVNVDDKVETRFIVDLLFVSEFRRRDGGQFLPSNQGEAWMAIQPFKPKPGDAFITPMGKEYPIDQVEVISPDGYPVIYSLRFIDG